MPGSSIDPDRRLTDGERQKRYRERHPDRVHADFATRRARNRGIVDLAKDRPCEDCGLRFPPECMDFDHVRGEKRGDVGRMAMQKGAVITLLAEIAKCEVVCANCHRIRTRVRRQYIGRKHGVTLRAPIHVVDRKAEGW